MLIYIIICVQTKSNPIFKQVRVGKNGTDFSIYKFRTINGTISDKFPLTKAEYIESSTKFTRFLRKYKLDEIPQLINVVKGDMSFVGPRPVLRKFVELYNDEQKRVLEVRPGITDIATIKYRNEQSLLESVENPEQYYINVIMPDKLQLSLEYIQHQNIFRDLIIILKTIFPKK